MGLLIGHCYLNRHPIKLGLADSPRCGTCRLAIEAALHVLCECETSATWN